MTWALALALALGAIFFVSRYAAVGSSMFHDLTWLLAVMISCAYALLAYATTTLVGLFPEMNELVNWRDSSYLRPLKYWLSDRNLILSGIVFGLMNCFDGASVWSLVLRLGRKSNSLLRIFCRGLISGIAAYCIVGMSVALRGFVRNGKPMIDYRSPDRCGGASFLGVALSKFAVVTLAMATLISLYVVFSPRTNGGHSSVRLLKWIWIAFPFGMSSIAFFVPGIAIHKALKVYKEQEERSINRKLRALEAQAPGATRAEKHLRDEYDYLVERRVDLYRMRTWPYKVESGVKYVCALIADGLPALVEVHKLVAENNLRF